MRILEKLKKSHGFAFIIKDCLRNGKYLIGMKKLFYFWQHFNDLRSSRFLGITSNYFQAAGFFGVLSSALSIFTLSVITLERNYAITHAMHLNKRLSLRHAAYIMVCGWIYGIAMASLPLVGVSDYSKFAVCLPFETG